MDTIKTLGAALLTTKVAGEKEAETNAGTLAMRVERYNPGDIGNKSISMNGSEVLLPVNFTACGNQSGSVNRMVCLAKCFSGAPNDCFL